MEIERRSATTLHSSAGGKQGLGDASDPLEDCAGAEAAAAAHRDERVLAVGALELVEGLGDRHRAGAAEGVAEGDGAAVGVTLSMSGAI
jgi:hypothetical protein